MEAQAHRTLSDPQPTWRIAPEIDSDRQEEFNRRLQSADPKRGFLPFKNVRLYREDVEWLLLTQTASATSLADPARQKTSGKIDLRGADLRGVNLSGLPLNGLDLTRTQLQKAILRDTDLRETNFFYAHLEGADLRRTHLEGANLTYAYLGGADLRGAFLNMTTSLTAVSLKDEEYGVISIADLHWGGINPALLAWPVERVPSKNLLLHWLGKRMIESKKPSPDPTTIQLPSLSSGRKPEQATEHTRAILRTKPFLFKRLQQIADSILRRGKKGFRYCKIYFVQLITWKELSLGDEQQAEKESLHYLGPLLQEMRFAGALRAYLQLARELRSQGDTRIADLVAYRAQWLQRRIFFRQRHLISAFLSYLLDVLTGYGYRMRRITRAYIMAISFFAFLYYGLGFIAAPRIGLLEAFIFSVTAFHGRVFVTRFQPDSPQAIITAVEAITGLLLEAIFIAMLTQRIFNR